MPPTAPRSTGLCATTPLSTTAATHRPVRAGSPAWACYAGAMPAPRLLPALTPASTALTALRPPGGPWAGAWAGAWAGPDDDHVARPTSTFPAGVDGRRGVRLSPAQLRFLARLRAELPADLPLYVTSGQRTPAEQAAALKTKRDLGDDLHALYAADDIIAELLAGPNDTGRMAAIIDRYAAAGRLLSKHQRAGAVDLRSKILTRAQIDQVLAAAKRLGVKAIYETKPPHIHVDIDTAGARIAGNLIARGQSAAGQAGKAAGRGAGALFGGGKGARRLRTVLLWTAGAAGIAALMVTFAAVRRG